MLLMDDGVGAEDIAKLLGVHVRTVFDWKASIAKTAEPAAMLADAPASLSRKRMRRG